MLQFLVPLLTLAWVDRPPAESPRALDEAPTVATFSIVAFDPDTGDLGVAVESRFFAVGAVVPWARSGVGAVATQAFANTTFGPKGLDLLASGKPAPEALDALVRGDAESAHRQVGMVDARGRPATYTGARCNAWAGGRTGLHYAVQGNILTGREVVDAMASSFESTGSLPLADRLVRALAAGQAAGGDSRGQQSAALLVVRAKGGYAGFNDRYIDLRVDDHPKPIEELGRLLEMHHTDNAYADARFHLERGAKERAAGLMEEATRKRLARPGAADADRGNAHYDLACFYSIAGDKAKALENLARSFDLNPTLAAYSANDTDLDPLRKEAGYLRLVKEHAPPPAK